MTEKEKAIALYMKNLDLSKEEAEALWEDDHSEEDIPEVKALTEKAKKAGTVGEYTVTEKVKKRTGEKVRKVDEQKKLILETLVTPLEKIGAVDIATKTETEISFSISGNKYTLKLTKHRKEKEGV